MSSVNIEGKCGAINPDNSSCQGYYIIKFYSFSYTLKADLRIDGQVISSSAVVCEVNYLFSINSNSH